MPAICLYFQIHRPYKLRRYTVFDLGQNSVYEDDDRNCDAMLHAARNCYLPMNDLLLRLIQKHEGRFKVSFSISGMALEQFEQYAPEVLDSFKALAATNCVEFLGETYSHSMTFLYAPQEFARQVKLHSQKIEEYFGQKPTTYRHTEHIYNNDLAVGVEKMGFLAMLGEGSDQVLGWRSPNFVYEPLNCKKMKLLLRNVSLSNDIALRFGQKEWDAWPLTAEKFASWCDVENAEGESINLFMPYEIFGIKHKADTGIFDFMESLPGLLLDQGATFKTPSQIAKAAKTAGKIDVPYFMSWALSGHDLDTWLGNDMQKDAIHSLYGLVDLQPHLCGEEICRTWQRLQSSDNFAHMCTKWFSDEQSLSSKSPYASPYDAYINFMNVLADFELVLKSMQTEQVSTTRASKKPSATKKTVAKSSSKSTKATEKSAASSKTAPSEMKLTSVKATKVEVGAVKTAKSTKSTATKKTTTKSSAKKTKATT